MLQHRGQDSAGMVTFDGTRFMEKKDNGLVANIFDKKSIDSLEGSVGIGHVRYPTAGGLSATEAQPFFVNSPLGIYLIHNGNLTNADELMSSLGGRMMKTSSDSEVCSTSSPRMSTRNSRRTPTPTWTRRCSTP